jgi:hypothetical protein
MVSDSYIMIRVVLPINVDFRLRPRVAEEVL